jgi:hypothetical protein
VIAIVRASSSTSAGGSDATPCETIVRQRSTGSPPGPRSGRSTTVGAAVSDWLTVEALL